MYDGYLPTYTGYADGVINFKLVTNPRCTGLYWIGLCNDIANQYKMHVDLLKDATNFKVAYFIANDIIGFNINSGCKLPLIRTAYYYKIRFFFV